MNIPNNYLQVEGQEGLYYKDTTYTINGSSFTSRDLRADDSHCFYDNTLPEEERIYMEYNWKLNFIIVKCNYFSILY